LCPTLQLMIDLSILARPVAPNPPPPAHVTRPMAGGEGCGRIEFSTQFAKHLCEPEGEQLLGPPLSLLASQLSDRELALRLSPPPQHDCGPASLSRGPHSRTKHTGRAKAAIRLENRQA